MVPVPRAGVFRVVEGRYDAEAVPGITDITITMPSGSRVRPLPDGDQYLGFIFAEAATPGEVEKALITASERLRVVNTVSPPRPGHVPVTARRKVDGPDRGGVAGDVGLLGRPQS
jgi:hypothetical protein